MAQVCIGTSGWQYASWRGRFYPAGLPQREWLSYFSERFPTVEINNSFYRLPEEATFTSWRERSSGDFLFAVKASRYVTHIRRLRDCGDAVGLFWSRATALRPKLGPVLFQLPPNLRCDHALLADFLAVLPEDLRPAFEFRHDSWSNNRVHEMLEGAGAALVLADRPRARVPPIVCAGWSYIRFHAGASDKPDYSRDKLRRWARRIERLNARDVFVYFNNDTGGAALRDAAALAGMLHIRLPQQAEGLRAVQ